MNSIPSDADPPPAAAGPPADPSSDRQLREILDEAQGDIGINPASIPHAPKRPRRRRKVRLPLLLFLLTCITTYAAGCYQWVPTFMGLPFEIQVQAGDTYTDHEGQIVTATRPQKVAAHWHSVLRYNWRDGLIYMVCVLSVLLFHEMGHFLMTLRHRVPASLPFFIPFPMMLTGTMGAVIAMDPYKANRREVFDIGIAGPLAGLLLILPMVICGLKIADAEPLVPNATGYEWGDPLLVKILIPLVRDMDQTKKDYARRTNQPDSIKHDFTLKPNAILMAGWVGLLVTGLNMMPVSQLDGGHVLFGLLGSWSRYFARAFLIAVIVAMIWYNAYQWVLMLLLVIVIGPDHPPTADDTAKLGPFRWTLGFVSLAIPILCFPPFVFRMIN